MTVIPEIREQICGAAARQVANGPVSTPRAKLRRQAGVFFRPSGSSRPTASAVGLLLGAFVAVAVAGLVVVGIGHRTREGRSHRLSSAGSVSARSLVTILGVLRRQQTAADRGLLSAPLIRRLGSRALPALTRLVATVRAPLVSGVEPFRIYFVVVDLGAGRGSRLMTVVEHGHGFGIGPPLAAPLLSRAISATPSVGAISSRGRVGFFFSVAPDRVARVKWTFTTHHTRASRSSALTVYPTIHNNVAVARSPGQRADPQKITWYDSRGHVIASFSAR